MATPREDHLLTLLAAANEHIAELEAECRALIADALRGLAEIEAILRSRGIIVGRTE